MEEAAEQAALVHAVVVMVQGKLPILDEDLYDKSVKHFRPRGPGLDQYVHGLLPGPREHPHR